MLSMSFQQYDEFLKKHKLSNDQEQTQIVKKVGRRIQTAVEQYFAEKNTSYLLRGYDWEFNLGDAFTINLHANIWVRPNVAVPLLFGEKFSYDSPVPELASAEH